MAAVENHYCPCRSTVTSPKSVFVLALRIFQNTVLFLFSCVSPSPSQHLDCGL